MNEPIKPEEQPSTPTPKLTQKKYANNLTISVILSVAALALSIFVGFYYYTNSKHQNQRLETLDALKTQQLQDDRKLTELFNTIAAEQASQQAEHKKFVTALNDLEEKQQQNWAQRQSDEIWRLYEAQYLINTAYWTLVVNHDVKTALALLQSADQQIQLLNDPALTPLRDILLKDKTTLEAIPAHDPHVIIAKLNGLLEKLYALPKHSRGLAQPTSTTPNKETSLESTASGLWNRVKEYFQEIVHIRRNNETFQPLLSELEQTQLVQSLALQIQQAQFAAIHYDEALYKHSLEQFKSLLTRFFKTENNEVNALLKQTDELLAITISPPLPNLAEALEAVQLAIKQELNKSHSVRGNDL